MSAHVPFGDDFVFSDIRAAVVSADGTIVRTVNGHPITPGTSLFLRTPVEAAAPMLLSALQAIVASLAEHDDEGMIEHAEQMVAARAAIAAATGESHE